MTLNRLIAFLGSILILTACDDVGQNISSPLDQEVDQEVVGGIADQGSGSQDLGLPDQEIDLGSVSMLSAEAGPSQYALVNQEIRVDGSESIAAITYQWDFGNGEGQTVPSSDPIAMVSYAEPGRYQVTLTVTDQDGVIQRDQLVVTVTQPIRHQPAHSDTLVRLMPEALGQAYDNKDRYGVVVTDDQAIVIFGETEQGFEVLGRLETAQTPRTMTTWTMYPERPTTSTRLAVVCQDAQLVQIFRVLDGQLVGQVPLPNGSRPFGITFGGDGKRLFVTLQGTGQVAEIIGVDNDQWELDRVVNLGSDLRGITRLPDDRLAVTRWRSPDQHGEIWVWDPQGVQATEQWQLAYDPQEASDTEIGGVPSYLDQLIVNPQGSELALPSTQALFAHGSLTSGRPTASDEVLRAVVSFIDLGRGEELFERRKQFDGRGLASAGVYTSRGDFLYLAMRGSRTVERLDRLTGNQSGTIVDTGIAVEGLMLSRDDQLLFVNATLDRSVKVFDVSSFSSLPTLVTDIPLVLEEPLAPEILLGKQLFNDSADPRLSREGYLACAHCHLDGDGDHRTWDFSDRGEGLRQTISLLGRGGMAHGPLHWSANFDEIQDFESDLRNEFGGFGLMADSDYHEGTRNQSLGDPKEGLSEDLDALAAYMESLNTYLISPYRQTDGSLSMIASQGKGLFFSAEVGCSECHSPPNMTDSGFNEGGQPILHDVGTINPNSGFRLGTPLVGLDTPTLHGLWHSPPYLHDGSAQSLREVLTIRNEGNMHGRTSQLTPEQVEQLEAYLLSLDGRWE